MPALKPLPPKVAKPQVDPQLPRILAQLEKNAEVVAKRAAALEEAQESRRDLMRTAHEMGASYRQIAKVTKQVPQSVLNQLKPKGAA